ncbi:MAG: glycosyltransferase family 4 protein, partial [Candidatus Eisenbacteria bacterium]
LFHVPNFLRLGAYEPSYKRSDFFIYVGRLSEEKGVDVLLDAQKKLRKMRLVIVGDGGMREELRRKVSDSDRVTFLGFLPEAKLVETWRAAAFTVVPSVCYENSPYAVLESLAFGKPVIATKMGGIPEMVRDGENGFLVEPGNSEHLADRISYLASHPEETWRLGKVARRTVEQTYSAERHFENVMSLYERILR